MPRHARIRGFGDYHIISLRGVNKQRVFENEEEKIKLLDIIWENVKKFKITLCAYCIMDNHYHLIINDNKRNISEIFKAINYKYSIYYNRKHDRVGHLFQERFYNKIIKDERHMDAEINYLLDNPVRAGIVNHQSLYKWSRKFSFYGL